jgi:hypothetical protein
MKYGHHKNRRELVTSVYVSYIYVGDHIFRKKSETWAYIDEKGDRREGSREWHIYMLQADQTFTLKLKLRDLIGWYSGNI